MQYKQFQNLQLPVLGMGALRLPLEAGSKSRISRPEAQRMIDYALDNGVNYIDTAYTYNQGDSEIFLGEALKKHPRDSYYLATKFYAAASKDICAVFEEQLRRCQTDYFDFYLLHSLDENYIGPYTDPELDYLGFLQEQKRLGRIRYLGFSSHAQPDTLARFLDWYDGFDMAQIQINYLDWKVLNAKRQYEILTERNIPVWVMEPLKGGSLAKLTPESAQILKKASPSASLAEWSYRFLMSLPNIQMVLSGLGKMSDAEENIRLFSDITPLDQGEWDILQKAAEIFVQQMGVPCSACRYCCATCPAELDIPELIRSYNEYCISGETWKVSGQQALIHGPSTCIGCGICREHCPQKIDIPDVMLRYSQALKRL